LAWLGLAWLGFSMRYVLNFIHYLLELQTSKD